MKERYQCPVGLSDHSGSIIPSLAACMKGACLLEVHVVFDKRQFGPDSQASLNFEQLEDLVRGVRQIEVAVDHPVDKDQIAAESTANRERFSKGLYAAADLSAGTTIQAEHLRILKPALGISAANYEATLGQTINKAIPAGEPVRAEDLTE